ncbi:unnamed protein product [Trichobilharzia szidati]|nr:unnamed protein product [Trichobilharzia szidati]
MAKRRADIELNQDNWDEELEPKKVEEFAKADKEILSQRKILTARTHRSSNTGTAGLFKSFTGFSNCSNVKAASFNFGQTSVNNTKNGHKDEDAEYLEHVQALNQNLLDWITKHIKEDPFCILTPIFTDYDKHLSDINSKFPKQSAAEVIPLSKKKEESSATNINSEVSKPSTTSAPPSLFTFGNALSKSSTTTPPVTTTDSVDKKPSFSFGLPPISTVNSTFPQSLFQFSKTPSFSQKTTESDSKQVFTFGNQQTEDDDNEEYVPPKPEVKEIKEDGSVFSTRCKLFYKVDTEWRERGLGNLFIKPTATDKFQLLMRADTNLGNILLNVLITKDVPIKQQKNNLTLVCVPSPPLPSQGKSSSGSKEGDEQPKPVPLLIRVKTEEAAGELLSQMDLHRGVTTKS